MKYLEERNRKIVDAIINKADIVPGRSRFNRNIRFFYDGEI